MPKRKRAFPWLSLTRKSQTELPERPPIWLGSRSNGEYFHDQTKEEALIHRLTMQRADEQARKLGMERREFLASSMGMFTTLAIINQVSGCGGKDGSGMTGMSPSDVQNMMAGSSAGTAGSGAAGVMAGNSATAGMGTSGASGTSASGAGGTGGAPSGSGGVGGGGAGGMGGGGGTGGTPVGECPYVVPVEATCEETQLLDGNKEFVFDIQTHSFDAGEWRMTNTTYSGFLGFLAACTDYGDDRLNCFDDKHYGKYMFVDSDTTMSVITSWPAQLCTADVTSACGLPLSNEGMRDLREKMNLLVKSQRCVNQIQVMPNDRWELQNEVMTMAAEDPAWRAVSWKAYPAWGPGMNGAALGGTGYFMNDETGRRFIERGLELGIPNFAIHKGLPIPGFDMEHNQPIEIGDVAKMYPEANLIIYHSGIGAGTESLIGLAGNEDLPFDESIEDPLQHIGLDQLIASLRRAGIGPSGGNVYAELGSAWSNVMNNAVAAQHFIGKLLKYVGPDNIVWGTDCILYGSPQPQIESFRMFQITQQFQDMYGYPALTPEIKAKIFGLNSARIFCIDPTARRCAATESTFAQMKRHWDSELGPRRWVAQRPPAPTSRREFLQLAKMAIAKRSPGA